MTNSEQQKTRLPREVLLESDRIRDTERGAVSRILDRMSRVSMPKSDLAANFPMWARSRDIARFLARYEIFRAIAEVPGCVFECGVHYGGGLASWIHISEIFEPVAFTRRLFGFDTFSGFPGVSSHDSSQFSAAHQLGDFSVGDLKTEIIGNLMDIDSTRKVEVAQRLQLIVGDACKTIPELLKSDPSIAVALLYLDFDLYEPTKNTLLEVLPRMPKGGVVVLDQFGDPEWPGESKALFETLGFGVALKSFPWCPRISYFKVGE